MNNNWRYCPYCCEPIDICECDGGQDERLPRTYAEIEYSDFDSAEAVDGARWDDLNYQHYMDR